jgi:hypothetical protein
MIAPGADGSILIPEKEVVRIAGVARSTWQDWVQHGLLQEREGGYGRQDVVGAAAVKAIRAALGFDDTRSAWHQVENEVRSTKRIPRRLDVGFDHQYSHALLLRTDKQVAAFVRHARSFTVVPIAEQLKLAAEAFDRLSQR